jgi:putative hemolysin
MKKYILMTIFSFITAISYADDHEWTTYTGEVLQCNLKDGKSVEDVMDMVRTDCMN